MRLTSDFFVSALIRRVFAEGGYAAVEARGAAEAGAIFIRCRRRDGLETLFGPAPQSAFEEERPARLFECRLRDAGADAVEALIARERKWDSDLWLVELETEDPARFLDIAEMPS